MIYLNEAGEARNVLTWTPVTTRTDGTAFTEAEYKNYELGTSDPDDPTDDFVPFVSVPAGWGVSEWPLDDLGFTTVGRKEIALRVVGKEGSPSGWSEPLVFTAALAPPSAPTGLALV